MSRNYFSEFHLHIVWHTKESYPISTEEIEQFAHRALRQKIVAWSGAFVHEINGTPTHVHLAVTLAPTILVSEFIGQLKGSSSHEVNLRLGRKVLEWQTGYGVVNFGTKDMEWVLQYIRNQKEHHAQGDIHDRLERISADHA